MTGFELSRRKMLGSLGAVGAAAAGGGYGATAYLSDQDRFVHNRLVAGHLDLKSGWEEHYASTAASYESSLEHEVLPGSSTTIPTNYVGVPDPTDPVIYLHMDDLSAFLDTTLQEQFPTGGLDGDDPCEALGEPSSDLLAPLIDFDDVKPGDFGEVTFTFALCDNPGYVWLTGELVNEAENGTNETERLVDGPGVELTDAIRTVVWYDDDCDNVLDPRDRGTESVLFRGSLRELVAQTTTGLLLDGNRDTLETDCFQPNVPHCLGFAWWLPADVGNQVQSDSVTFDLGFYTEQCRHNVVENGDDFTDISFVAFCVPDDSTVDLSRSDVTLTYSDDDAPSTLQWDTGSVPISTVVVKAGRCSGTGPTVDPSVEGMTNFYPGDSSGEVTACAGDPADPGSQCPRSPAPSGEDTLLKLEYENGAFVEDSTQDSCDGAGST